MSKNGPIDYSDTSMWGHVLITDTATKEVLLDKHNQIHPENMVVTLAKGISGQSDGAIYSMVFGNGGTAVSGTGGITYYPPNITGVNADLYNPTFEKVINDPSTDTSKNFIEVRHLVGTVYTDIIVTCTLDYGEPSGQDAFDDSSDADSTFTFDELGLKAQNDSGTGSGLLLSHLIFNPVLKSLNRQIEIIYTIRISIV